MKKTTLFLAAAAVSLLPSLAHADCFVSYKAKKDDPLKLHFGVAEVSQNACKPAAAGAELTPRLEAGGWQLLTIVDMLDAASLEKAKDRAGAFFLRY